MQRKAIAIFDFDGTMIPGDSIVAFVRYAIRRGKLCPLAVFSQAWNAWRGIKGRTSIEEGKSRALRFLARMGEDERSAFCRDFCREKLLPAIYPKALARKKQHAEAGEPVLLVSASPDIYMRHLREWLPLAAVLATPTDAQGRVAYNMRGEEKLLQVQAWAEAQTFEVDWEGSWAYGDSAHDLHVMQLTGHPVVVNARQAMITQGAHLPWEDWRA